MTFKELLTSIRYDLGAGKIKVKYVILAFFFNPSFRLLLNYRIGKYYNSSKWTINKIISNRYRIIQLKKRNCQISFNTTIGKGLKFAHPIGIVIGDGVIIGDNVKIWQQVTLGSHGKRNEKLEYPFIGNGVKIFAGARIIGGVRVGENAIIGANAVVMINVPDNCTAVGIPAKIIHNN
jgi:serine O-acetyltransferase